MIFSVPGIVLAVPAPALKVPGYGSNRAFVHDSLKNLNSMLQVRGIWRLLFWIWLTKFLGLHTTLAYHDVSSIKNTVTFEHYSGRVEATHFDESSVYVTFGALVGHQASVTALDPQLQGLADDGQFQRSTQELYILDNDADDLPGKLEIYMKKMAPIFYDRELSDFMKPTLTLASELSQSKKVSLIECNMNRSA
jgi:hypothetical protein